MTLLQSIALKLGCQANSAPGAQNSDGGLLSWQQNRQILFRRLAEQVPVHPQGIAEERLPDRTVKQMRAEQVQSFRFVPEGLGVYDSMALFGFVQQAKKVLGHH